MRRLYTLTLPLLMLLACVAARAQEEFRPDLPALGAAKSITLSPSYSCRTGEEFQRGYRKTALFLTETARRYNSPDLLFNGACGSEDEFQSATHGGNTSFVVDLGPSVTLESAPPLDTLLGEDARARGERSNKRAPVKVGHTYAVRLDKRIARGWFAFTVLRHDPNKSVEIRYTVQEYRPGEKLNPPPALPADGDDHPRR